MSETIESLIVGDVEAIYFENPNNLYKVVRINVDQEESDLIIGDSIVITGQFATLHVDTTYEFYGHLTNHPKYGEQFAVERYQQVALTSEFGLVEYLSSNRFKGVGTVIAQRVVDKLGMQAIERIIADATALDGITGLSKKVADNLRRKVIEHQGTEQVIMKLNEWGFGPSLSEKIYQIYGSGAIEVIQENPFDLVEQVEGIGFNKADQLAEKLGMEADAQERLIAGLFATVSEISNSNGDTCVEEALLLQEAQKLLEKSRPFMIDEASLNQALESALQKETLFRIDTGVMIPSLYYAELGIVHYIDQYLTYEQIERFEQAEIAAAIEAVEAELAITYDATQKEALKTAIDSPMSVITGGPGTGKTTLINGLIHMHAILHEYDLEEVSAKPDKNPILLAAPTGRASKRMQETTGMPATTIHRLIGFTRESVVEEFSATQLEGSLLIVDEMSMVDTWLMHWLLQAVPYELQVIFVGDRDQLPSVGPGKVFNDLIASRMIPSISLTKIYRQARDSSIIQLAHAVRQGQLPGDFLAKKHDRTFIQATSEQIGPAVKQIVEHAVKKGFDANNLQVLAPMYRGPAGINALNELLQELLNPPRTRRRELQYFDTVFRVGDKVLQLVNNTEEGVYNGDIGRIEAIFYKKETESKQDELVVSFDEKELTYLRGDLDQLALAYCMSIHKSQGSEYDLVILPLIDLYSRLLRKDVLYTAITRAQKSLILIGNPESFHKAVHQQQSERQTFLGELLQVKASERNPDYQTAVAKASEKPKQTKQDKLPESAKSPDEALETDPKLSQVGTGDKVLGAVPGVTVVAQEASSEPSMEEPPSDIPKVLTPDNYLQIDPLIGMHDISPYDFMVET